MRKQTGFTYLALLIAITIMGIVQGVLGDSWHAMAQREKEAQLLFAGNQIRQALMWYDAHTPAQARRHPASLDELLNDPRTPARQHYLRKLYPDPMTGTADWALIRGAGGEIYGVHSRSEQRPLKRSNFARANKNFEDAKKYSEWIFLYAPGAVR